MDDLKLTNEAIYWRGLFIQRYAGMEFGLTHLLATAGVSPAYADAGPPPYKLSSKLHRLRQFLERPGELANEGGALLSPLAYFESIEESRHFSVHGVMSVKAIEGEAICRFRLYQHRAGDFKLGVWDVPLNQFRDFVEEFGGHASAFGNLTVRIAKKMTADFRKRHARPPAVQN